MLAATAAATMTLAAGGASAMGLTEEPKVAFIYIAPVGDLGWTYMHDQSRLAVEERLGIETAFTESIPEVTTDVRNVIDRYVSRGYNVIVGTAYGYSDAFLQAAEEYPDVVFMNAAGTTSAANLTSYYGRSYEGMYLAGMAAGAVTETNKLGFVAAYPLGLVLWNVNAFALGAQRVNPDAEVIVSFTNTWYDPVLEEETAQALIEQGVDVIGQHQDTPGPQIAAEKAGIHSVGYNADMSGSAPTAHIMASTFDWGDFVVPAIQAAQEGTFEGGFSFTGLDTGVVDISAFTGDAVPEDVRAQILDVKQQIASGAFHPFTGPIRDNAGTVVVEDGVVMDDGALWGMNFLVEGVIGALPE
ncbi:MAG: BMP family ABC transporter substrate-binding protein [Alphaproteobacteria bacterium]